MNGSFSGRVDGGVGISLADPSIEITATPQDSGFEIDCSAASDTDRAEIEDELRSALQKIKQNFGFSGLQVSVTSPLPAHAGLGSKTALLLALARAYTLVNSVDLTNRDLARLVGRAGTSGIGVEAFASGGLVVDCGHSFKEKGSTFRASSRSREIHPPPLVGRYDFPEWPILIVTPVARKIHGALEQALFEEVCPIPLEDVRAVSHATLMMLIPGVIEQEIDIFARGINVIQDCRWKYFEIQSQSPVVNKLLLCLKDNGVVGAGMSSWGSSVFAVDQVLLDENRRHEILSICSPPFPISQSG